MTIKVESREDIVKFMASDDALRVYTDETGGEVVDASGATVARISFNGRAWAPSGAEIK